VTENSVPPFGAVSGSVDPLMASRTPNSVFVVEPQPIDVDERALTGAVDVMLES
jgi:hypothetical protein